MLQKISRESIRRSKRVSVLGYFVAINIMEYPVEVKKYFESHAISPEVLKAFQVEWNGKQIVFPVFNIVGEKIFSIYRRNPISEIGPRFMYEKGSHVALYGINIANGFKHILITEGLSDCLCAWSHAIPAITSTGGALSFQESWKDLLCDKEIYICLDSDSAGGKGTAKIFDIFPTAKIIFLPEKKGCKDLSDFMFNGGDINKLMASAKTFNSPEEIQSDMADRAALWQNISFHEAYLENHGEKPIENTKKAYKGSGDDLQRAKQYPIDRLIKFGRDNKAPCIFHNDRNSSMHLYRDKNRIFCFGCSKSADVLDCYQQINGCTLSEAIKALK